jgi:hypothetical protein
MVQHNQTDRPSLFVLVIASGVPRVTAIDPPSLALKNGTKFGSFQTAGAAWVRNGQTLPRMPQAIR